MSEDITISQARLKENNLEIEQIARNIRILVEGNMEIPWLLRELEEKESDDNHNSNQDNSVCADSDNLPG